MAVAWTDHTQPMIFSHKHDAAVQKPSQFATPQALAIAEYLTRVNNVPARQLQLTTSQASRELVVIPLVFDLGREDRIARVLEF